LKDAVLYFDRVIINPVVASWATIGADHRFGEAIKQLLDLDILQMLMSADVQAKYVSPHVQQTYTVRDQLASFRAA
jgi:hypothetical protein